jgi:DNA-binding transcriptional MerR regulator
MEPAAQPRFSMSELVEASGLSDRTIRFYIEEGLVQGARGRGRSAYYTPEHVERLMRVADLRNRGLSLAEIREALSPMAPQPQVQAEIWERRLLHPLLEVSVRSDAPEDIRMLVRRFEQLAEQWFDTLGQDRPGEFGS